MPTCTQQTGWCPFLVGQFRKLVDLLPFCTEADQHHQPVEKPPRSKDEYGSIRFGARGRIGRLAAPLPCFLLSACPHKRVASTHWSRYPLLATDSSLKRLYRQRGRRAQGPIAHLLRRSTTNPFHSHLK